MSKRQNIAGVETMELSSPDRFTGFNQTCGQNKSHHTFHSSTSHLPPKVKYIKISFQRKYLG